METNNSTIKEKSLNRDEAGIPALAPAPVAAATIDEIDERILTALHAAGEKKAGDLALLDLHGIATFTDYFVIASGSNTRQVQAISDEVMERLKKAGTRASRIEGYRKAEWILLDYGDFIVHVFEEKARRFYDLERLWREGRRVALGAEFSTESIGSLRTES